jgi:hypothetical protein
MASTLDAGVHPAGIGGLPDDPVASACAAGADPAVQLIVPTAPTTASVRPSLGNRVHIVHLTESKTKLRGWRAFTARSSATVLPNASMESPILQQNQGFHLCARRDATIAWRRSESSSSTIMLASAASRAASRRR